MIGEDRPPLLGLPNGGKPSFVVSGAISPYTCCLSYISFSLSNQLQPQSVFFSFAEVDG